jgi:hypothetical protein
VGEERQDSENSELRATSRGRWRAGVEGELVDGTLSRSVTSFCC